jgi:hypothetical protein
MCILLAISTVYAYVYAYFFDVENLFAVPSGRAVEVDHLLRL